MLNRPARESRRPAGDANPEPARLRTILAGLRPSLVINLARLQGETLEDLGVTMRLFPWGDRAALAAYGVVRLGDDTRAARRGLWVEPLALDVVAEAARVVATTADPAAVAKYLDSIADDDDFDAAQGGAYALVEAEEHLTPRDGVLVPGVVDRIDGGGDGGRRLTVVVTPVAAYPGGHGHDAAQRVRVATDGDFEVEVGEQVLVAYQVEGSDLTARKITREPSPPVSRSR